MTGDLDGHQEGQFVVFRLVNEQYGIPINAVHEIIVLQRSNRLPQMPDYVEGIVDLRGRIIPVVDLRKRFGFPPRPEQSNRTIVADIGEIEAGLLVDDVVGVIRVPTDAIQPPPGMFTTNTAMVSGVARVDNRLVILLDPNLILTEREQERLEAQVAE